MEIDKLLWIGPYMTKEALDKAVEKGYLQVAATLSQSYFLDGLENNFGKKIDILSAIRPPAFPTYKNVFVLKETIHHSDQITGNNVGFLNIKYISHLSRQSSLLVSAKKWANLNKDKSVRIIVYALHSPFLKAALKIKELVSDSEVIVIVPDLPLYMDMSSTIQRFLKRIDWKKIKELILSIDKFVLFTKNMASYLGLPANKWIVIEGLMDNSKIEDDSHAEKYDKNIVLYMGTLKKEYRIDTLVEAFKNIEQENLELHIYGNGDYKEELEKISEIHKNIKYCGYVSSDKAFNLMKKATLLVNPRPTKDEYTKYSCPSKTFEYMASGTPLLTTKLEGIPDEYFKYTYCFEDESVEGLRKKIQEVIKKGDDDLKETGYSAKEFIRNEKNNVVQTKKIMDFIREI
jgi:glycosyltransferase involved in cell wall biosynthesis